MIIQIECKMTKWPRSHNRKDYLTLLITQYYVKLLKNLLQNDRGFLVCSMMAGLVTLC